MTTPSTSFSTRTRPTATLTESITTGSGGRRTKRPYDTDVTRLLPRWLLVTVIAVIIAFIAVPVLYIVFGSVNSDVAVARGEYFPSEFTLSNYVEIWSTVARGRGLVNSMLTAGAGAVASAALAVSTAYVLVRFRFLGRLTILRGLLALQSIPGTLLLLPVFVVFSNIASATGVQIIGTRWGLFVTYLTFALPFVLVGIPVPASVEVMPVLTYIASFQSFRFGLSAAMAICSLVIVAIPLFVYLRAVKLDTGDDAGPNRKQRRADRAVLAAPAAADVEGARA